MEKMEKSKFRVLIKHYFFREKTISETKAKLDKYYGDSALSISMVKKWFTQFRCSRISTIDAERSGHPIEVAIPETIEKFAILLADRRLKVREIVEAIGISILKDHLGMKNPSARWVPRLLTIDHKHNRVTTSIECLALFNRNEDEFLRQFVRVDETCQRPSNSPNSGFCRVNQRRRRPKWICQPIKSWLLFSGMHAV